MDDFFMLNSLQAHVINLNNQINKKRQVSKRYHDIFDKGCLFLDGSTTHPVIKPFQEVLKIHPSTNIADIIHLFFTKKQIRKKGDLPFPKIIKNAKSYQRGGEGLSPLNISNSRRNIYEYELSSPESSYIVKLAKHKIYSCAYKDEADIYIKMCNVNNRCDSSNGDVVKYISSGVVSNNTIKINETDITLDGYKQDNPEIQNMQYLVLENTDKLGFVDFKKYIDKNRSTQTNIFKVFNEIMRVIKKYNNEFGFFHGDLHTSNVKVKVENGNGNSLNIKVKLFDFDFAGILNPSPSPPQSPAPNNAVISSNIMAYKLTDSKGQEMFQRSSRNSGSTNPTNQSCEKVVMNNKYEYTKNFMYVFDYYRLLFSTLLELKIEPNDAKSIPSQDIADKVNFFNIIDWYSEQKDIVWKDCFRKSAFCKNIYEQAHVNSQTPQYIPRTPQQQTCKKCENISPKIEELRKKFLERCQQGNISSCSSNESSNFGSSPASAKATGGRKVVKRQAK
jgi:hypothetical protein